jgi:serine phosphatase RsbU (regulator of sigma subunit)
VARIKLRWRLSAVTAGIVLLLSGGLAVVLHVTTGGALGEQARAGLVLAGEAVLAATTQGGLPAVLEGLEDSPALQSVYLFHGERLVETAGRRRTPPELEPGEVVERDGSLWLSVADDDTRLVLAVDADYLNGASTSHILPAAGLVLGLALLVFLVTYLSTGAYQRGLEELGRGFERLGRGELSYRMHSSDPPGLVPVYKSFNRAADYLEKSQAERAEKERLVRELQLAHELQERLLPSGSPDYEGLRAAGICQPADFVGGDYYDFIPIDDRRLGVVIADVSGKGLRGLMMMLVLRTLLRGAAPRHQNALPALCETNRLLTGELSGGSFITCLYLVFDNLNQTVEVVNAGHNPLLVFRYAEEKVEPLKSRGRPLGILPPADFDAKLEPVRLRLSRGDCLLVYTDGVTEAMNERQEIFGQERLVAVFEEHARLAPPVLVDKIAREAHRFSGSSDQFDDLTIVALRSEGRVFKFKDPALLEEGAVSQHIDRALSESRPFNKHRDTRS